MLVWLVVAAPGSLLDTEGEQAEAEPGGRRTKRPGRTATLRLEDVDRYMPRHRSGYANPATPLMDRLDIALWQSAEAVSPGSETVNRHRRCPRFARLILKQDYLRQYT